MSGTTRAGSAVGMSRSSRVPGLFLLALVLPLAATASQADALAISQNIQARHLPYVTVLDPIFNSPTGDQIVNYTRCGDSALWTGMYLAAEAFRYTVTHSADALANARRAVAGIQALVDATGNNALARCVVPTTSPYAASIQSEEAANGIYTSGSNFWVGNTSRDEYSGVIFGLGTAYDFIPDATLQASIAAQITRLVQFLLDHLWTIVLPDGTVSTTFLDRPDEQLAFLEVAQHVNPAQFSQPYASAAGSLANAVILPIAFDTLSDSSYFKFNLDTMNLYSLVHLETGSYLSGYQQAYSVLRKHTASQGNAFFNMIDRALNGPDPVRDPATALMLDQWLQRPRRDVHIDNTGKYPSCGDPTVACQPIPVPDRVTTDFLWQRSPYQLANTGGAGIIESAGIDYILPYWMARAYNIVAADHLQIGSAASGTLPLAPGAIASIFGLTLGANSGVTVTVKDSAAVSRSATVFFASTSQVNFLVPADTALGIAAFTVHSPNAPDVTVSAPVKAVAPSLFTADASGTGVAAATALRVVISQQIQFPAFSCSATGCAAVPLTLGVDTPLYLTLYGTGIRNRSSLSDVTCTIGGISVPVLYAGPQPQYAGLDQVNVPITLNLRGLGQTSVVVTVDGQPSNPVLVNIQ